MACCLLERNFSLGGAASVYKVGALTVEASLHQTSDPRDPRDVKRRILDELGLLDEIEWISTGPLYTVRGGPLDEPFALPVGFDAAANALAARFPAHGKAIERFPRIARSDPGRALESFAASEDRRSANRRSGLADCAPVAADWRASLADVLAREFGEDEALKCALGANLFYYGDDPKRMWFIFYALAQGGYIGSRRRLYQRRLAAIEPQARQGDHQGRRRRCGSAARRARSRSTATAGPSPCAMSSRKSGEDEERVAARVVLANCGPNIVGDLLPEPGARGLGRRRSARARSPPRCSARIIGLSAQPDRRSASPIIRASCCRTG